MILNKEKSLYIYNLVYILKLAFKKYKGLYVVYIASVVSILIEFLAIGILGMISKQTFEVNIHFLQNIQKDELFLLFILLFLIRFISLFVIESWIVYYAKELQVYMSSTAFTKVVHENIKDIEKVEIGHYITLSGDEASNASQLLISSMSILSSTLLVIVYLVSLIMFANNVFIWMIVLLLIIAILVKQVYKKLFKLGHDQAILRRKTSSMFMDAFNALRVIKAFSLEQFVSEQYKTEIAKYFSVNSLLIIYGFLTKYIPIVLLFVLFELYLLEGYMHNKIYDIAFLITLLFVLARLLQSIGVLAGVLGKIVGELKGVNNIVTFIEEFYTNNKSKILEENIRDIQVDNLSFSYKDNTIFDNLNLFFKAGESYAIYGESGSGKSTLLDLIMDFTSPDSGRVLINGINVQEIQENNLTKKVMYVGQDSLVFNKSIRENIELDRTFSENELLDVLKIVKLDEMVEQYDEGINHMLYYKGTNISGGQRQRINLARALIRKPDVLILDEATSALDSETKEYIVSRILEEYKDKIIIFVTHDTSILPLVSDIIDLKKVKKNNEC